MTEVLLVAILVLLLVVFALLLRHPWTVERGDDGADALFDSAAGSSGRALTDRELEVARLAVLGYSESEIARALHISFHTVRTHMRRVYGKLGVHTRRDLLAVLEHEGLLERPDARPHSE